MRSRRLESLMALSRLEHSATVTIQTAFRYWKQRQRKERRRQAELTKLATAVFDVLVAEEIAHRLVPTAILNAFREAQHPSEASAEATPEQDDLAIARILTATLYEEFMREAVDECIRVVFQSTLDSLVRDYLIHNADLTRTTVPTNDAVALDILDEWTKDLVGLLILDALSEVVAEYMLTKQAATMFSRLLAQQLRAVAIEAINELGHCETTETGDK
ncbi:TPA: hypothetical protein N0F65_001463 [Lagenidium giganteum]|uniref:Uncharacterized protein n=1 Tax=Lagenidium giganteum TaxID=4803 RepID=A0AAV2YL28_9STRA|nr:TPA: hypothetical protein N0F65_001463 [Lagenidium giganteum]